MAANTPHHAATVRRTGLPLVVLELGRGYDKAKFLAFLKKWAPARSA